MSEIHIVSCITRVLPTHLSRIIETIQARNDCEVFAADESGKLVLVLEGNSAGYLLDQLDELRLLEGVLSIDLVYQHAEEEAKMKELMPCH